MDDSIRRIIQSEIESEPAPVAVRQSAHGILAHLRRVGAARWVAAIEDSPKPPPRRITLTLPVVTHGVRVAFVATGASKTDILKKIFEEGNGLPCALVNEGTGERCSWFVDNAAVEGVSFPRRGSL